MYKKMFCHLQFFGRSHNWTAATQAALHQQVWRRPGGPQQRRFGAHQADHLPEEDDYDGDEAAVTAHEPIVWLITLH